MVTITSIARAPRAPMGDRGETIPLVNPAIGARHADVHVNVLRAGGPDGRYHYHPASENVYIVLSGTGRFVAEGVEHTLRKDDVVFIPPGVRHSLSARGDDNLVLVEIYTPLPAEFVPVDAEPGGTGPRGAAGSPR
jgi:mannose-6-phosphate isomerase-like protein (cupin superfamily)